MFSTGVKRKPRLLSSGYLTEEQMCAEGNHDDANSNRMFGGVSWCCGLAFLQLHHKSDSCTKPAFVLLSKVKKTVALTVGWTGNCPSYGKYWVRSLISCFTLTSLLQKHICRTTGRCYYSNPLLHNGKTLHYTKGNQIYLSIVYIVLTWKQYLGGASFYVWQFKL